MLSDRDRYRGFTDEDAPYLKWFRAAARDAGLDRHQTEGVISAYQANAHRVSALTMEQRAELAATWFMVPGIDQARALDVFRSADKVLTQGIDSMQPATPSPQADRARLAEIEAVMKADFRSYYQSPELQGEYREILERQHGGTEPAPAIAAPGGPIVAHVPAAGDRAKQIEAMMYGPGGTHGPYWRSEALQTEYRQLSAPVASQEGTPPNA